MQLSLNKFFIFTDNRTGSSCLTSLISHAYRVEYQCPGMLGSISEPFHPKVIEYFYGKKLYNNLYSKKPNYEQNPTKWKNEGRVLKENQSFVRDVFNNAFSYSHGIKHIWSHLFEKDNKHLIDLANARGYKIIFLNRNQVVKKTLSYLLSESTDTWANYEERPQFKPIDINRLDLLINKYNTERKTYGDYLSNTKYYDLNYEDFLGFDDPSKKIEKYKDILSFCGINNNVFDVRFCENILSPSRKINTREILESIPNFNEVQAFAKDKYNENVT